SAFLRARPGEGAPAANSGWVVVPFPVRARRAGFAKMTTSCVESRRRQSLVDSLSPGPLLLQHRHSPLVPYSPRQDDKFNRSCTLEKIMAKVWGVFGAGS